MRRPRPDGCARLAQDTLAPLLFTKRSAPLRPPIQHNATYLLFTALAVPTHQVHKTGLTLLHHAAGSGDLPALQARRRALLMTAGDGSDDGGRWFCSRPCLRLPRGVRASTLRSRSCSRSMQSRAAKSKSDAMIVSYSRSDQLLSEAIS